VGADLAVEFAISSDIRSGFDVERRRLWDDERYMSHAPIQIQPIANPTYPSCRRFNSCNVIVANVKIPINGDISMINAKLSIRRESYSKPALELMTMSKVGILSSRKRMLVANYGQNVDEECLVSHAYQMWLRCTHLCGSPNQPFLPLRAVSSVNSIRAICHKAVFVY